MNSPARLEIRIGEHGYRLEHDFPPPTPSDLAQADILRKAARIDIKWLAGNGLEVRASQWVGLARFEHFDVVVEPRLVGGDARVLQMLEFAAGFEQASLIPNPRPLPPIGPDLLDLVCHLLAREAEEILRGGILSDYRSVDEALPVLRGRLRVRDQMLSRFGQLDQLECSFDEYDSDIIENHLVRCGLAAARRLARHPEVRRMVQRVSSPWEQACPSSPSAAIVRHSEITYRRRNERYRRAHHLSRLLLDGSGLGDMFESGQGSISAFFINMANLFERFLTRLLTDQLNKSDLKVDAQHSYSAVVTNDATGSTYQQLRPDLVVSNQEETRVIPIDAKYKNYDLKKLDPGDLYQTFTYAYTLSRPTTERHAVVVFPSISTREENVSVAALGSVPVAKITICGIDVPLILAEIESGEIFPAAALVDRLLQIFLRHPVA